MSAIISIENVSKRYVIKHGATTEKRRTLSDALVEFLKNPLRRGDASRNEEFWALKNVSFDVNAGEVVGIIGRNGAGKSTLLKILGRITDPSEGRVRLRGRVASLLEVGTGFHPELTGRENIFLNGAILGMTRAEIRRSFDAIVAFSEVEKFLDTPVKRYSSGMYVRLAFSVAAHLEPEILIVDEVLAVGDAAFQEKCLGKMRGVAQSEGRTVLFVSHNMASIRQLCQRVCLLDKGEIATIGTADEAIGKYLTRAISARTVDVTSWDDRIGTGEARIVEIELQPDQAEGLPTVRMGERLRVRIRARFDTALENPVFGLMIHDTMGVSIVDLRSVHHPLELGRVAGEITLEVTVDSIGLYPGHYFFSPWITDAGCQRDIDHVRMCCAFDVLPPASERDLQLDRDYGNYFVPSAWTAK